MLQKKWMPLVTVFTVITIVTLAAGNWLTTKGVDTAVLLVGNLILFGASLGAMYLYASALKSHKSFGFVKQVYAGFILKFFVLVVAAMVYFYFAEEVNKPALFICMLLYLIYNFLGTAQVVKKAPNAGKHVKKHDHRAKHSHH